MSNKTNITNTQDIAMAKKQWININKWISKMKREKENKTCMWKQQTEFAQKSHLNIIKTANRRTQKKIQKNVITV